MPQENSYEHVVHFIIFSLAVILFFKIIEPLIKIMLTSIIITYTSFPLYKRIRNVVTNQFASIVLVIVIITLILLLPFSYLVVGISQQSFGFYSSLSGNIAKGTLFGFTCERADSKICSIINSADEFSATRLSNVGAEKYVQQALSRIIEITTNYLIRIPQAMLGTGLALFISYFLFRDGEKITRIVIRWLPFRKKTSNKLISQFKKITYTIVFAQLFVALAQGIVGMIGFYMFGVPFAVFWGVVMAFFGLVPTVGTAVIWVPASLFLILSGYLTQNYAVSIKGVGMLAYGIFVISTIDNLLRVKIIDVKAEVHPIIVISGLIGGVNLFGVIGLFVGPILLSILITYFGTFKERFM